MWKLDDIEKKPNKTRGIDIKKESPVSRKCKISSVKFLAINWFVNELYESTLNYIGLYDWEVCLRDILTHALNIVYFLSGLKIMSYQNNDLNKTINKGLYILNMHKLFHPPKPKKVSIHIVTHVPTEKLRQCKAYLLR